MGRLSTTEGGTLQEIEFFGNEAKILSEKLKQPHTFGKELRGMDGILSDLPS